MDAEPRAELRERLRKRLADRPLPAWRGPCSDRTKARFEFRGRRLRVKKVFGLRGYATYRAHELRTEYSLIEMNLQSLFGHYAERPTFDLLSVDQAISILDASRAELERDEPNVDTVDRDLGRARRLMIWLYPAEWLDAQTASIHARLASFDDPEARAFKVDATDPDKLQFQLDEAIGMTDRLMSARAINNGLQLRRLEMVRNLGLLALLALWAFAPVLVDGASLSAWGGGSMDGMATWAIAWITTAAIALVGATGAALSGLLQARDRPVTSMDYQVRGIEVVLRMVVGAVVAIVLYFLLSWQVLPAMAVSSPGTYLLIAFLAGFSERYFLGLLGLEKQGSTGSPTPMTPIAPPPMASSGSAAGPEATISRPQGSQSTRRRPSLRRGRASKGNSSGT